MAVSYRGASNAVGQSAGVTTSAGTVSITPTLPASSASGDRVFVIACGSNTSGTTPTNWNVLGTKDNIVGTGAVSAGGGQRYLSVYYRDYDGVWTMPAFTLTSATQNSHWIGAVSVSKSSGDAWDTPTISVDGEYFGTAGTAYSATTGSSFTTHTNGFIIVGAVQNDNVTSTGGTLTQSGATFGTVTERCDGGTATGNDVSGTVHTCSVTTGAAATVTFAKTLSAASQGGNVIIEQTVTFTPTAWPDFEAVGTLPAGGSGTTINVPVPSGVAADDIILVPFYVETNQAVTPPAGFAEVSDLPVTVVGSGTHTLHVFWKRATGADAGTYDFTIAAGLAWRQAYAVRYSGCITTGNPFDVTAVNSTTSSTASVPAISDTTTVANTLLVWVASGVGTAAITVTAPTSFTKRQDWNASDNGLSIADLPQAAAGATGSLTGTFAASMNGIAVWLGALKPPAVGGGPPTGAFFGMF